MHAHQVAHEVVGNDIPTLPFPGDDRDELMQESNLSIRTKEHHRPCAGNAWPSCAVHLDLFSPKATSPLDASQAGGGVDVVIHIHKDSLRSLDAEAAQWRGLEAQLWPMAERAVQSIRRAYPAVQQVYILSQMAPRSHIPAIWVRSPERGFCHGREAWGVY